jgi:hypothetical protein
VSEQRSFGGSLDEYRVELLRTEQRSQAEFDKTLLTLSGGALGVSFAFVNQFLGEEPPVATAALIVAWACWIASLAGVLLSHYFSTLALRKAVRQVDEGTILMESVGGRFDKAVAVLNAAGGILFIAGLIAIGYFVTSNLEETHGREEAAAAGAPAAGAQDSPVAQARGEEWLPSSAAATPAEEEGLERGLAKS